MNKAVFALLTALAYGAFAGDVLSGDAAKAKFPAAVQAMELSETKWSQLMSGVEYGFTHAADQPDDPPAPPEEPEDETIIYVSPSGDGTAPHRGFATGYAHFEDAIAAANANGDIQTILLDAQTHSLTNTGDLMLNKPVTICGVGTKEETVLDGQNKGCQFKVQASAAGTFLHTFSMTRMSSAYGGSLGITLTGRSTISNVVLRQNGNTFNGNARYPLQAYNGSLVTHCWITNNIAPNNAGVMLSGDARNNTTMENCYLADNVNKGGNVMWAAIVDIGDHCTMRNCTVVNNKSGNSVVLCKGANAKLYNNIIWGNTYYTTSDLNNWTLNAVGMSQANWKGNCTYPLAGSADDGNTKEDPLLQEDQMHFYSTSPCRGAAIADYAPAIDIELHERGGTPSIGAFEYVAGSKLVCVVSATAASAIQPATITLSCSIDGAVTYPVSYAWDLDGDGTVDTRDASPVLSEVGVYNPVVTITDAASKTATGTYSTEIVIFSPEGTVYVTSQENPKAKPPFATRETAATNILEAMQYAQNGTTVLLDEGTHYVNAEVEITKTVTVRGEAGADKTFLSKKSGLHRLFYLKSPEAIVEGFTVKGCGFFNYFVGAIVYIYQGTIRDCKFIGNTLCGHGAVTSEQAGSQVVIERCEFRGNYVNGTQGPAAIKTNTDGTIIRNCLFVANTNTVSGANKSYWGGAVQLAAGGSQLVNCTLVGNVSYNPGGAGVYNPNNATVVNCICVNNMQRTNDMENAGQYVYLDSNDIGTNPAKQSHSLVWPTTFDYSSFTQILTENPQFKTNYTFSSYGPCVRKGLYQDWMKGATDFFGNSRATPGKHVDMGYWQSPAPGLMLRVR